MAYAKNDHEFRMAPTVNGVVQSFTPWVRLTDSNSSLVNGRVVLTIGNYDISSGNLQVRVAANLDVNRPAGAILSNTVPFLYAVPDAGAGFALTAPETVPVPAGITLTSVNAPDTYGQNSPPQALQVQITNKYFYRVGATLQCSYTYAHAENVAEGTSTYQWYKRDPQGNTLAVTGATSSSLLIGSNLKGYGLSCEVTPVDTNGLAGVPVLTPWTDYVVAAEPAWTTVIPVFANLQNATVNNGKVLRAVTSSAASGHTTQGVTGYGAVEFWPEIANVKSGIGGGNLNSANYGNAFAIELGMEFEFALSKVREAAGNQLALAGTVPAGSRWRVSRLADTDSNGNEITGTYKYYFAYCPVAGGVFKTVYKSTLAANPAQPLGFDFVLPADVTVAGQGWNVLLIGSTFANF